MGRPVLFLRVGLARRALVAMAETATGNLDCTGIVIKADLGHDLADEMRMEINPDPPA